MVFLPFIISDTACDEDRSFMIDLYQSYHRMMFKTAYKYAKSRFDAEDIVQDAIVSLIGRIGFLRALDAPALCAYINKTVVNKGLMHIRRRESSRFVDADITDMASIQSDDLPLDLDLLRRCSIEELKAVLLKLGEMDRVILSMKYYMEYDDKTIAKEFGIKEVSVRSRLTRARQRAYSILKEMNQND